MIAVWAAAAHAGTAGLGVGVMAPRGAAVPTLGGQVAAWVSVAPRPWGVAAEVAGWRRVDGDRPYVEGESVYQISRGSARVAGFGELALGTHATTFHLGLGPALIVTHARVRYAGADRTHTGPTPAVAARLALDGPVGPSSSLGWQFRVGAAVHATGSVDYDTALGLGVAF